MIPIISVIVPVYNVEEYLDKCIDSVINQTYTNLEIILIDDGSTDKSGIMCDLWKNKDERIKVIHKKNEGLGYARNSGLNNSTGEYIFFIDSDDYIPKNAIELLYKRIVFDKSDMVIGQFVKCYKDGKIEKSSYQWISDGVLKQREAFKLIGSKKAQLPVQAPAKLYKSSVFRNLRFCNYKKGEDVEIFPKVLSECTLISLTTDIVYFYYQRETSIMHQISDEKLLDNIKSVCYVAEFLLNIKEIDGAKIFYKSAILQAAEMQNFYLAKKYIYNKFPFYKRIFLFSWDFYMFFAQLSLYIPNIYKIFKVCVNKLKSVFKK